MGGSTKRGEGVGNVKIGPPRTVRAPAWITANEVHFAARIGLLASMPFPWRGRLRGKPDCTCPQVETWGQSGTMPAKAHSSCSSRSSSRSPQRHHGCWQSTTSIRVYTQARWRASHPEYDVTWRIVKRAEAVVQAIALVELTREGWVERVHEGRRCFPVLVHQLLAMTLQLGAESAELCLDQLFEVPDFQDISRTEALEVVDHMKIEGYLYESGGLLSMGDKAERVFGRKNFAELYAVISSPVLYRVATKSGRDIGALEQAFVDRLVEDMSSFLLGGRAWTVEHVRHEDRHVIVRDAPRGVKPRWGGFIPQHLGFDRCQRIASILSSDRDFPYVDPSAATIVAERRDELGPLLRRRGPWLQVDSEGARWWTFAGGRINQTLKHALEIQAGWKVQVDNFGVKIAGDGVTQESVRSAISAMAAPEHWTLPERRRGIVARLPDYRLSKFQPSLPERFGLEVVATYLLDFDGAAAWLRGLD